MKEQSMDYGTLLESLKKQFNAREKRLALISKCISPVVGMDKDLLQEKWETFHSRPSK
jgi:hypothetical protein